MNKFLEKINKICRENKKVAMFIDMDGTIVEYLIYLEGEIFTNTKRRQKHKKS